ncbi:MAG TPA: alanine--tRNA ligase [Steroidobacteraceae bacterium]|jgi:alanyl-tRNA synthetase|nr:alanine--tRNA ligase [Steroidobacteraceae bacterium]
MSAADVRRAFLEFFRERGHTVVPSSSLVPGNDPTLLFTNAGMVQFKDCFLGRDKRDYVRAASSQRCVRAGGKHNDLENVGYTARHHTFFEMLGNFSFGDYFKKDAIRFAWDFVTGTLGIDPARLMVTVYQTDDEAFDLWHKMIGLPAEKIVRIGDKPGGGSDNFWQMGDTGPCGPCTEIFYDHGAHIKGGPPGSPDDDGDRWVEIWNLVFMQFDRASDGKLTPLPKPSVDTGAGLERVSAVMQGVTNNYDIDIFVDLIQEAARLLGTNELTNPSLRVIADHIRACSFLITDGVVPSNEGRGYVLRRIARRAMRHGHKFGVSPTFFNELVPTLVKVMGDAFPELVKAQARVRDVLLREGEQFERTLENGMEILEAALKKSGGNTIDGETIFKLHDTYGFPTDLTADIARERGLTADMAGYERAMQRQRELSQAASKFGMDMSSGVKVEGRTEFLGYEGISDVGVVTTLLKGGVAVDRLAAGEQGEVILDRTPFYAESGGQVGDTGELGNVSARFVVADTQKRGTAYSHLGTLETGEIRVGDRLAAKVDAARRKAIMANHSATHLLHSALRRVLGGHVQQKGSLVAPDRLRFDFAHNSPVTLEEQRRIENIVNEQIRANAPAEMREMPYDAAVAAGAIALFGEKYEKDVRVLRFGDFSMELCGGTHVARMGDIGLFKIVSEGGVQAGVRRIEAVTAQGAYDYVTATDQIVRDLAGLLRGTRDDVKTKVSDALERIRQLEKENRSLKDKLASGQGTDLSAGARDIAGVKLVAAQVDGADAGALRNAVDQLKDKLKSAVIVLASVDATNKITLVAGVTADQTSKVKAGELVGNVAGQVGGKGGGRPDFAQAGGNNPAALGAALASVEAFVRTKLGA